MSGEPSLWWRRFQSYRDIGPKRSLQKTFEKERAKLVLLGTKEENPKQVVPGSWKLASKTWNWVARARAWDEWCVDAVTEIRLISVLDGLALKTNRIHCLKTIAETMCNDFNLNYNHNNLSLEQECAMIARIQSLFKDIREEMETFDDAVTRVLLRKRVASDFATLTEEEYREKLVDR